MFVLHDCVDNSKGKKSSKKKGSSNDDSSQWIERHTWHISQLEKNKERLAQNLITISNVEELKEDVEYYIDSYQSPDFYFDELAYEALDEAATENEGGGGVLLLLQQASGNLYFS